MVFTLNTSLTSNTWGPSRKSAGSTDPASSTGSLETSRGERIYRTIDFTSFTHHRSRNQQRDAEQEAKLDDFQLVDTTKAPKKFVAPARKRHQQQQNRLRQLNARTRGGDNKPAMEGHRNQPQRTKKRSNWGGRGGGGRGGWNPRVERQASVAIQDEWILVEELPFNGLNKTRVETLPEGEDLLSCGFLDNYNDSYDRVSTKTAVPLKRAETKEFYPVTTTDDPVIEQLAVEEKGNVFVTDTIMSHLMASARSVIPWDIVAVKLPNGALFFDKRPDSQLDFLTVSETANMSQLRIDDNPESINSQAKLSIEATMINQNFSQQILKSAGRKHMENPNPFFDDEDADGMEPASVAYRYRRFKLDDMNLVVRCELHGLVQKRGEEQKMTAFAINEWDSKLSGGINWRDKIDGQKGAVLATELKNNSCKLAKWTIQSILADADQMKIGYVSRATKSNAYEHVILATQFYEPKQFATQITLSMHNMWGVFKTMVDFLGKQPAGKYVIMRDPNTPKLRLFAVPPNTFEEDDEEE